VVQPLYIEWLRHRGNLIHKFHSRHRGGMRKPHLMRLPRPHFVRPRNDKKLLSLLLQAIRRPAIAAVARLTVKHV